MYGYEYESEFARTKTSMSDYEFASGDFMSVEGRSMWLWTCMHR